MIFGLNTIRSAMMQLITYVGTRGPTLGTIRRQYRLRSIYSDIHYLIDLSYKDET